MSPRDALRESDHMATGDKATDDKQGGPVDSGSFSYTHGGGRGGNSNKKVKGKGKISKYGGIAAGILILIIVLIFFVVVSPYLQIDQISTALEQSTASYYTDMNERKADVMQEALYEGEVPSGTAERLKENGVTVGYMENGNFVESNQGVAKVAFVGDSLEGDGRGELVVKVGEKIVTAGEFYNEYNSNVTLYNALNNATYGRAAYYYDDYANKIFRELGTSRNDYNSTTDFKETTDRLMGEGNKIVISTEWSGESDSNQGGSSSGCQSNRDENGDEYMMCENSVDGENSSARELVQRVQEVNKDSDQNVATMNAADSLAIADEISTEQRSMKFYVAVMQNISKVKAGYGGVGSGHDSILGVFSTLGAINNSNSGSNINDVMNMLYQTSTVQVVDVESGDVVEITGSMLEAPSLYSMLAGEKVNLESVQNYSTERVLKTVENKINTDSAGDDTLSTSAASAGKNISGEIRRVTSGSNTASDISVVETTVNYSLIDNSFDTVAGIPGGELLAQGAVNLGAELALASGSTVGDAEAINEYAKLTDVVLALDAESDHINRNPLDITSKNTFLGSIMYKFAVASLRSSSILGKVASVSRVTASSIFSLMPKTYADDEEAKTSYLTTIGTCERYDLIGASGTASCSRNEVFDTSTYGNNIFRDSGFQNFIDDNLECTDSITCEVKEGSKLEEFLKNNMEREAPIGVVDTDILNEDGGGGIFGALRRLFSPNSVNEEEKKKATGEAYVNASTNDDWDTTYKYAQAYQSINRAISAMRKYDGDATAYNFKGFGLNDPIVAWINKNYPDYTTIANN